MLLAGDSPYKGMRAAAARKQWFTDPDDATETGDCDIEDVLAGGPSTREEGDGENIADPGS